MWKIMAELKTMTKISDKIAQCELKPLTTIDCQAGFIFQFVWGSFFDSFNCCYRQCKQRAIEPQQPKLSDVHCSFYKAQKTCFVFIIRYIRISHKMYAHRQMVYLPTTTILYSLFSCWPDTGYSVEHFVL